MPLLLLLLLLLLGQREVQIEKFNLPFKTERMLENVLGLLSYRAYISIVKVLLGKLNQDTKQVSRGAIGAQLAGYLSFRMEERTKLFVEVASPL